MFGFLRGYKTVIGVVMLIASGVTALGSALGFSPADAGLDSKDLLGLILGTGFSGLGLTGLGLRSKLERMQPEDCGPFCIDVNRGGPKALAALWGFLAAAGVLAGSAFARMRWLMALSLALFVATFCACAQVREFDAAHDRAALGACMAEAALRCERESRVEQPPAAAPDGPAHPEPAEGPALANGGN